MRKFASKTVAQQVEDEVVQKVVYNKYDGEYGNVGSIYENKKVIL